MIAAAPGSTFSVVLPGVAPLPILSALCAVEELSRQLRAEIRALQEYIAQVEDRFLVATWTIELLRPLERLEARLERADLASIVVLLQRVRDQFSVNGNLAPQINQVLARYPQYLGPTAASVPAEEPALDPVPGAPLSEDEERQEPVAAPAAKRQAPQTTGADPGWSTAGGDGSEDLSGMSIDVFTARGKATKGNPPPPSSSTLNLFPLGEKKKRATTDRINATPRQDLFLAHKIRPADLKTRMQFSLTSQEQVELDFKLQKKMGSRLVDVLRDRAADQSLLLIPRVTQFVHRGTVHPCSAKVLLKLFRPLLANPEEWAAYRGSPFMEETPEAGWALVSPEALPDTLGFSFAEQQRRLRQRAEDLGVVPRLLRRRSLVEALYDLLAAQLVLGLQLNRHTRDATNSGPDAGRFISIYSTPEGIRIAEMPRTASHPALGVSSSL